MVEVLLTLKQVSECNSRIKIATMLQNMIMDFELFLIQLLLVNFLYKEL